MFRSILALSLVLALPVVAAAAASPSSHASIEEFARAIGMKRGGWHTSMKVTSIEVDLPPGTDPALLEPVKAAMPLKVGSVQEQHECVGPDAGEPSLPGILLGQGCSHSGMESGDGRWAVSSMCSNMPGGGTAATSARGTFAPEVVTGVQELEMSLQGLVVRLKGDTVSRYTGKQCRPREPIVQVTVTPPKKD